MGLQTKSWLVLAGRFVTGLAAAAVLILFLAWMAGTFHSKIPPGEEPVPRPAVEGRQLVAVERKHTDETTTAVAAVQPRRKTDVASQILATVLEVKVQPGQRVQRGTPLIVLDNRELLAQQREILAAVSAAEADLVVRKRDYDRTREVWNKGAGTREDFDRVEGAYNVAVAQLRRLKEQVNRIEIQLSYTHIEAASAAVVADRFVDPGDLAVPGKPLLALQETAELELHASVPESQALRIRMGQELPFRIDAARVAGQGPVREIVPLAQQATRSVLIKVTIPPDLSAPVFTGMFGRVAIPIGQTERLLIPISAVQHVGQLEMVEVAGKDGFLSRRFIRTGRPYDSKVEVLSGLSAEEVVSSQ
jgi:RND family efflux transporter MFP subunit